MPRISHGDAVDAAAPDWAERLRRETTRTLQRRAEARAARRATAARRTRGMAERHAWRLARRDARAAYDDRRPRPQPRDDPPRQALGAEASSAPRVRDGQE